MTIEELELDVKGYGPHDFDEEPDLTAIEALFGIAKALLKTLIKCNVHYKFMSYKNISVFLPFHFLLILMHTYLKLIESITSGSKNYCCFFLL